MTKEIADERRTLIAAGVKPFAVLVHPEYFGGMMHTFRWLWRDGDDGLEYIDLKVYLDSKVDRYQILTQREHALYERANKAEAIVAKWRELKNYWQFAVHDPRVSDPFIEMGLRQLMKLEDPGDAR